MNYQRPSFLFSAHLETIYPSLLRHVSLPPYTRERIATPDHDFLDLDWLTSGGDTVVIISHGLEGDSHRPYVTGMGRAFHQAGYDVLAWNYRGCSGQLNLQRRFYHSGATDDLDLVVQHASRKYERIILIGFSLGGNLTLKYLGEQPLHTTIHKAVVFSVPLHLHSSCLQISTPGNWLYAQRFLKSLKKKVLDKAAVRSDIDVAPLSSIKTLIEFDNHYTSKVHGYRDAVDYYTQCSALYFLPAITVPTLIVNAANDPFLSTECFPTEKVSAHSFIKLEIPRHGGHVGFAQFNKKGLFWSEERALAFVTAHV
jgi:uncharacterized protein